jgi:hypothetical protein
MIRHDALMAGICEALDGDQTPPARAIIAALIVHVTHPAPADPGPCAVCVGTSTGLVDGQWVHCCCACPICSCGQPVCDDGCDTVEAIADALGVAATDGAGRG